jgi:lysophospholipase L1-like esterase
VCVERLRLLRGFVSVLLCAGVLTGCNSSDNPNSDPPDAVAPLALNCPTDIRQADAAGGGQVVSYGMPSPTGGLEPVTVSCAPVSGTLFPLGATTVTCTARDSGLQPRSAACSFSVTLLPSSASLSVTRFMAFGDSITKGEINNHDEDRRCDPGPESLSGIFLQARQPDFAYPGVVERLLTARYTAQTFTVVNEGSPNRRANEDTGRFSEALAVDSPEVVLLLQGILDVADGVSPISGLRQDVIAAQNSGVKAVLLSTLLPVSSGWRACGLSNSDIRDVNDQIRGLAASRNAVLVDSYAAFVGRLDTLIGPDGLHPSAEGQEVIGQLFFEAIKARFEASPSQGPSPARVR